MTVTNWDVSKVAVTGPVGTCGPALGEVGGTGGVALTGLGAAGLVHAAKTNATATVTAAVRTAFAAFISFPHLPSGPTERRPMRCSSWLADHDGVVSRALIVLPSRRWDDQVGSCRSARSCPNLGVTCG